VQESLCLIILRVVTSLVVSPASGWAQACPAVVVRNQSESSFNQFCEAFGLLDYSFAIPGTLSSDNVYQDARSSILDVVASKPASGRRAAAYAFKADTLEADITMLEIAGSERF
jgi:hypothetical protein